MILAKDLDFIHSFYSLQNICMQFLLGVIRQITEIYLSSVWEQYYIVSTIDLKHIDKRLLKTKPPHLFTCLLRFITDRKF